MVRKTEQQNTPMIVGEILSVRRIIITREESLEESLKNRKIDIKERMKYRVMMKRIKRTLETNGRLKTRSIGSLKGE